MQGDPKREWSEDKICPLLRSAYLILRNLVGRDIERIIVQYADMREWKGIWVPICSHFRDHNYYSRYEDPHRQWRRLDTLERWRTLAKRVNLITVATSRSLESECEEELWRSMHKNRIQAEIVPRLRALRNVFCVIGSASSYWPILDIAGSNEPSSRWPNVGTFFSGYSHPFTAGRFVSAVMDSDPVAVETMFDCPPSPPSSPPSPISLSPSPSNSVVIALHSLLSPAVSAISKALFGPIPVSAPQNLQSDVWKPFEDFAPLEPVTTTTTRIRWDPERKIAYKREIPSRSSVTESDGRRGIFIFTFPHGTDYDAVIRGEQRWDETHETKWREETERDLKHIKNPVFIMLATRTLWRDRSSEPFARSRLSLIELIEHCIAGKNPSLAELVAGLRSARPYCIWTLNLNGFDENNTFLFGDRML